MSLVYTCASSNAMRFNGIPLKIWKQGANQDALRFYQVILTVWESGTSVILCVSPAPIV